MNVEELLRTELASRAEDIPAAPPGLAADVVVGARRQRRNRAIGVVAAAACAAVVAVAVPVTLGGSGGTGSGGSDRATEMAAFTPYPQPPRGDLVGDEAYVDDLLTRDWYPSPELADPPVETRQVLFAGTVPGGVRALVSGWEDGRRTGLWLHGAVGADPDELEPVGDAALLPTGEPISFLSLVDGRGALVVLAEPGDLIEVSSGTEVAADGSVVRAPFVPVGDAEGLAVVDAAGLSPRTLSVRVTRDGSVVLEGLAGSAVLGGRADFDPSSALDGATGDPDPDLVRLLVDGVLEELDLTAEQIAVQVLWGGPIGNGNRPDVLAAALTVRLPSGALVAVGGYSDVQQPDGGDALTQFGPCLREIVPAGVDVTSVAMRCDLYGLEDGAGLGSRLVVVPPTGTTRLELIGRSGSVLGAQQVTGPAWVGPAPEGVAAVRALDGDQELGRLPVGSVQDLTD